MADIMSLWYFSPNMRSWCCPQPSTLKDGQWVVEAETCWLLSSCRNEVVRCLLLSLSSGEGVLPGPGIFAACFPSEDCPKQSFSLPRAEVSLVSPSSFRNTQHCRKPDVRRGLQSVA